MTLPVFNVPTNVIHDLNQAAAAADKVDRSELSPWPQGLGSVKMMHGALWDPQVGQIATEFWDAGDQGTKIYVADAPSPVAQHKRLNGKNSIFLFNPFFQMPRSQRLEVLIHEYIHTLDNPASPHTIASKEEFNAYVGAVLNMIRYTADSAYHAAGFVLEWYKMVEGYEAVLKPVGGYSPAQSWNWEGMWDCVRAGGFQQKLAVILRDFLTEYNRTRAFPQFSLG